MVSGEDWVDVGSTDELAQTPLKSCKARAIPIAISFKDGQFGAVSNICNHVGGPLGEGRLDDDYITCPWHGWKFHRRTGVGEPGFEEDRVPAFPVMDTTNPRFSGSDHLLDRALKSAADLGAETRLIRLNDLKFRACEGYYSKAAQACTWPCSITQMDASDGLDRVYEVFVHWADAVIVASPIRWGTASSLYFKMAERMNCVQNQITIANRVLIRNKVAGFIIVGGQDNIQMVAGQMLGFFAELGFIFPQFPFIAHSRGWSHEDMENNVAMVRNSKELADGACMLAKRLLDLAARLIAQDEAPASIERGGRKAQRV